MSKFAAHHYDRMEDDRDFAINVAPTFATTEEGEKLRRDHPQEYYRRLYQEQADQVQGAAHDPLPGAETIPGQRAAALAAHASCSPNRDRREAKPMWRAIAADRARSAERSVSPRATHERALVLGKPRGVADHTNPAVVAMRAEESLESQLASPSKGVADPQTRKDLKVQQLKAPSSKRSVVGITQGDLKVEAEAMIALLTEFNANGRAISQEVRNVLKELSAAALDILD